ncbi:SWIM zinc finger domain-containing protein [Nocardiopsis sp. NPDC058631]|uniref:SWIM zinc finger family protein n=1 Tax=Nocardiopsis sp. NPDC058631 TaxID=3346566 RepID=UPI0036537955
MRTFTREELLELAGRKSYDRGASYVPAVEGLSADRTTVRGTVTGTHAYRVELTPRRSGMSWECDCPWAEEGNFCKHCVALGLVYLSAVEHGTAVPVSAAPPDIRAYLESLDHAELVDLLVAAADTDEALSRRLEVRAASAAAATGGVVNMSALRAFVDQALRIDDFVEYREAGEYAATVAGVAGELEKLLHDGLHDEAEELSRYAVGRLGEYMPLTDDSAGHVGEAADHVLEAHVEACARAEPDPVELAEWLLDRQLNGSGVPELLLEPYAGVLGEVGLEHYGVRLAGIRASRPSADWGSRFLMSEFARVSGDVDLLVRVYSQDRDRVYYAGIVDALRSAGRDREALEWAERGLAAREGRPDERLVDHVVGAYRTAERWEDLCRVRWEAFEQSPEVGSYSALREDSTEKEWPQVRDQALAVLRRSAARRRSRHFPCSLVEVLLWEGSGDQAWEAATEHGCDDGQWLRIAALREDDHPGDALGVYVPQVARMVTRADTALYPRAAELARRVHGLYGRLGRPQDAAEFAAGLRREHKRKRRFLAELDRVGL